MAKPAAVTCCHHHVGMQATQQDLAYAEAVSSRFKAGTALNPGRAQAEEEYADSLVLIGRRFNDSKALAIAAESYMNLSPWDYYAQVIGYLSLCSSSVMLCYLTPSHLTSAVRHVLSVCVCSPTSCGLQLQKLKGCWWRRWAMIQISR